MNVPKLLVVDKSVFHTLHCCDEKLFAFARNYNVVLPDALAVECLISENQIGTNDKDPEKLFRSFQGAIKAGAKMGCSSSKLFQGEKITLCPVKSAVNEDNTKLFRNGVLNTEDIRQEAERCREVFEPIIRDCSINTEFFDVSGVQVPIFQHGITNRVGGYRYAWTGRIYSR